MNEFNVHIYSTVIVSGIKSKENIYNVLWKHDYINTIYKEFPRVNLWLINCTLLEQTLYKKVVLARKLN